MTQIIDTGRLFIGGTFRDAERTVPVIEAATGEVLADGPSATIADIDDAVASARGEGAARWRAASVDERADGLKRFAAALRARAQDTATLVSRENGMPISLSRARAGRGAAGASGAGRWGPGRSVRWH